MGLSYINLEPEAERRATETAPSRQRDKRGWLRPAAHTAVNSPTYDPCLFIENHTDRTWMLFSGYHALGTIDPGEQHSFRCRRSGLFSAKEFPPPSRADYIMIALNEEIFGLRIEDLSCGEGFFGLVPMTFDAEHAEDAIQERGRARSVMEAVRGSGAFTLQQLESMGAARIIEAARQGSQVHADLLERLRRLHARDEDDNR